MGIPEALRIVTMGDPRGVGPDVILMAAASLGSSFAPLVVGSERLLVQRAAQLNLPMYEGPIVEPDDSPADPLSHPGHAAISYLDYATAAIAGTDEPAFLLTAPIHKGAMHKAGFKYPGHTEYLAARSGIKRVFMMFANEELRVLLTTVHEPLTRVPKLLTVPRVVQTLLAAAQSCMVDFHIAQPRVALAGFNPHASEGGMFGHEENDILQPALDRAERDAVKAGWKVTFFGPVPPDTVFWEARNGSYDMVVALYHDQGLIAIKTLDFHGSVNVTLGLPYVRCSPDHGTAMGLAGSGLANPCSFISAWNLGNILLNNRIRRHA
ncbi:4-hydroxythreonine-4-phosphate dehydrogenase PdxA [Myxococcota bacterium]|nr:4-hydroxythreonine-4-phosphate dehydrogenase PdxA [Myxococcota bacterium]MBU1413171.1 4-hydroxythreonine-4-phosphate dehydrogenase PdxA [Myxococcota bacterium]MBU1510819.1 4-hydroxythreonine-4-phosphate dehydrogenase PdxA [Myxococcota bacterium]PKN27003.1 MAG: 4-hydroxythreonine-4-phosphate dehydrogenase PdxA [Deltaproteobacteria bacterium HGW-Deltaproteobacteria-22]